MNVVRIFVATICEEFFCFPVFNKKKEKKQIKTILDITVSKIGQNYMIPVFF